MVTRRRFSASVPRPRIVPVIRPTHLRAGLRVLRRHLRYAGGNPRKLFWVARRARQPRARGCDRAASSSGTSPRTRSTPTTRVVRALRARAGRRLRPRASPRSPRRPLISILLPVHDVPPSRF